MSWLSTEAEGGAACGASVDKVEARARGWGCVHGRSVRRTAPTRTVRLPHADGCISPRGPSPRWRGSPGRRARGSAAPPPRRRDKASTAVPKVASGGVVRGAAQRASRGSMGRRSWASHVWSRFFEAHMASQAKPWGVGPDAIGGERRNACVHSSLVAPFPATLPCPREAFRTHPLPKTCDRESRDGAFGEAPHGVPTLTFSCLIQPNSQLPTPKPAFFRSTLLLSFLLP